MKVVSGMASWSLHLALAPAVRRPQVQKRAELRLSAPGRAVRDYMQAGRRIEERPDWHGVELEHGGAANSGSLYNLCIHSPYRSVLTGFVLESLAKYDLDGFWFDGAILSHPGVVGCACRHGRTRFQRDEGLVFPTHADWNQPAFRRWVA